MGTHAPAFDRQGLDAPARLALVGRPSIHTRTSIAGVSALTALAAAARFAGLGHQSFWLDEAATVHIMQMHFGSMLWWLPYHEGTPPLYFVLAWLWSHIFGLSPVGLRSFSATCGILTIPVAWATGRLVSDDRAAAATAALTACNPLLIWYSQEARCYALLVLLAAVGLLAWLHLRRQPSARWAVVWGVASALSFATHWYSLLVIAPELLWLIRRRWATRSVRMAVFGLFIAGLCLLPLMIEQFRVLASSAPWMSRIPLGWRLELVPRDFAIGPNAAAAPWLLAGTATAVAIALWLLARRVTPTARRDLLPVVQMLLGSLLLFSLLLLSNPSQLNYRYVLPLWLPTALIVATGLTGRGAGRLGATALAGLCALGLAAATSVLLDARYQRPDWQAVAQAIGTSQPTPVWMVRGCSPAPLDLYLPGFGFSPPAGATSRELILLSADGQSSMAAVATSRWAETCWPVRHDFVAPNRIGPFVLSGPPIRIGDFRVWRMRAPQPVRLTGAWFQRAGLSGTLMTRPASAGRA